MKGRKPKLAVVEGGNQPGRCPCAPGWLSAYSKEEWKRAAPELHARGLTAPDMLATLESYCVAVGTVRECEEVMQREGRTLEGKTHPAHRVQSNSIKEARLLAAELGLTPHRRGVKGEDKGEKDGWTGSNLLA